MCIRRCVGITCPSLRTTTGADVPRASRTTKFPVPEERIATLRVKSGLSYDLKRGEKLIAWEITKWPENPVRDGRWVGLDVLEHGALKYKRGDDIRNDLRGVIEDTLEKEFGACVAMILKETRGAIRGGTLYEYAIYCPKGVGRGDPKSAALPKEMPSRGKYDRAEWKQSLDERNAPPTSYHQRRYEIGEDALDLLGGIGGSYIGTKEADTIEVWLSYAVGGGEIGGTKRLPGSHPGRKLHEVFRLIGAFRQYLPRIRKKMEDETGYAFLFTFDDAAEAMKGSKNSLLFEAISRTLEIEDRLLFQHGSRGYFERVDEGLL
jgi:hypothetical protein